MVVVGITQSPQETFSVRRTAACSNCVRRRRGEKNKTARLLRMLKHNRDGFPDISRWWVLYTGNPMTRYRDLGICRWCAKKEASSRGLIQNGGRRNRPNRAPATPGIFWTTRKARRKMENLRVGGRIYIYILVYYERV